MVGVCQFNLLINQPLILVAELVLILFLGVLAVFWLAGRPDLVAELQRLAQRITDSGWIPPCCSVCSCLSFSSRSSFLLFWFSCRFDPMLEELLKPLALWGLVNRPFDPVDGFCLRYVMRGYLCPHGNPWQPFPTRLISGRRCSRAV